MGTFLSDLNKNNPNLLPNAGEAILTNTCLYSHLENRLNQIGVKGEHHPKGLAIKVEKIINILKKTSIDLGRIVINPSDLGLHNMILNNRNLFL